MLINIWKFGLLSSAISSQRDIKSMGINLKRHRGADTETICSRELAQKGSLVCPGFLGGGINNIVVLAKSGWVHNIVAPLRDISAMAKMAAKDDVSVRFSQAASSILSTADAPVNLAHFPLVCPIV